MKKDLAALLSRVEVDQPETSHGAIGRLLKLATDPSSEKANEAAEAKQALFQLLSSSRLSAVSAACQGEIGSVVLWDGC